MRGLTPTLSLLALSGALTSVVAAPAIVAAPRGGVVIQNDGGQRVLDQHGAVSYIDVELGQHAPEVDFDKPMDDDFEDELEAILHHHGDRPDVSDLTIWQILTETKAKKFFTKFLEFAKKDEEIVKLLNSTDKKITLFAPKDPHWSPPGRRSYDHGGHGYTAEPSNDPFAAFDDDDDDDDKKKELLHKILLYHTLPSAANSSALVKHVTVPTGLPGWRVRIGTTHNYWHGWTLVLNLYSKVIAKDVKAKNGVLHVVTKPVLAAPDIFTGLFDYPEYFSTLTSALQKVELVEPLKSHDHNTTLFAPSNWAFEFIPPLLKRYLFSPHGAELLKKILSYHILPKTLFHSDFIDKEDDGDDDQAGLEAWMQMLKDLDPVDFALPYLHPHWPAAPDRGGDRYSPGRPGRKPEQGAAEHPHPPHHDHKHDDWHHHHPPLLNETYEFATLLGEDAPVHVDVFTFEYGRRKVIVEGVPAIPNDVPTGNGAVHVIHHLLKPKKKDHDSLFALVDHAPDVRTELDAWLNGEDVEDVDPRELDEHDQY